MLLELPFVGAYDWPLALRMIGAHAVPGGEVTDPAAGTHRRLLPGPAGPLASRCARTTARSPCRSTARSPTDVADLTRRVRHWLDLELDPASMVTRFGDDSTLGPSVRERPGLRRIRYPESFEAAISTVLGQQVSLAAARTFAGRLVAAYGEPGPGGLTAFPAPERLAAAELEELRSAVGITGSRARTVLAVAELFARTGSWPVPLPPESVGRAGRGAAGPARYRSVDRRLSPDAPVR